MKGPFNVEAREKAGMTKDFYEDLRGEMEWDFVPGSVTRKQVDGVGDLTEVQNATAAVQVGYD